jgi:type I restriction enzyme, R subunit
VEHTVTEKEAKARIKINKMLEEAGWRLLDSPAARANVHLETTIALKADQLGNDFEKLPIGHADYSLHDDNAYPVAVLEARYNRPRSMMVKFR